MQQKNERLMTDGIPCDFSISSDKEKDKEGHEVENENIVDLDVLEIALNSSEDENREHFPEFNEEKAMASPQIEVGLLFPTVVVYRRALRMFSMEKGFELKFIKNNQDKVTVICIRNCGWRIHASFYRGTKAFQVKSICGTPHRCPWSYNSRSASAKRLCNNFHKELADDREWRLKGFRGQLEEGRGTGRGVSGRRVRRVARGKGAGRNVSNNPTGWGRGNSGSLNGRARGGSSNINGTGKSASGRATAKKRGFSTSGARGGRGRGRNCPNPGPYSTIGN
ncbi:hypothetical protein ACH5RR_008514 [Cinchona calisaya]|uniref:Transposase MuDR plant domain-containing protein n=1 Tax=Cinchona calisaya TaxID=153742 RepID=A0ABD3AEI8_9GENT